MCSIELINTNILSGKPCFCLNIEGDMTVSISPTPNLGYHNLDDWNFVSTHDFGPNFLTCWRVTESLPSIFWEARWSPIRISRV